MGAAQIIVAGAATFNTARMAAVFLPVTDADVLLRHSPPPPSKQAMSEMKHTPCTPTPWLAVGRGVIELNDPGHNVGICECFAREIGEAEANAARIVHCVNNFDDVVGALEKLVRACTTEILPGDGGIPRGVRVPEKAIVEEARAAIRTAKGA